MRKLCVLLALCWLVPALAWARQTPEASEKAVVKAGEDVRFTVLTPGVIRMEWDSTGLFTDEASFVAVNRNLPVPQFTAKRSGKWLTITTEKMVMKYLVGSGKFSAANLSVVSPKKAAVAFEWKPGTKQKHNLKGTYRTLDGYDGDVYKDGTKMPIEDGLLAKDGWSLIDDSGSYVFDTSPWPWAKERANPNAQDWYFMAYGHDYKGALKEYTEFAGKVPLPPRYAFGYWWSRYWSYSDKELKELVGNFERFSVPLDVLVIDMDWHTTDSIGKVDEFGQRKWWTGWTWNKRLFPDPEKFLGWTNSKNLKTTLNLHPSSGIAPHEEVYGEFGKAMNFDISTGRNIPHEGSNKKYIQTLFDVVLKPMEAMGIDFWWLDWQQWIFDKKLDKLSNTWWLNYVFFSQMERERDTRPMLYHRWGGLGNHRYQIGFSGDSYVTWNSLEFQPYFTNCASNVLYGYWSHDIGGHMFMKDQKRELEPELYTRWLQYGVFSPFLRTHSTKDETLNKEIWNFRGDYFDAQHDAIRLRYDLVPYIYTASRQFYDTGIALCRPLYYDYPEEQNAYDFRNQFMFGDDILVAPIGAPMVDAISKVTVWLPAGNRWFEWNTGTLLDGGQVVEREFTLTEYPVYIKAGAIIPMYDNVKNLGAQPEKVRVAVFPGADGEGLLYEDNGDDKNYAGEYATTRFTAKSDNNRLTVNIAPREGKYDGMQQVRSYEVQVYCSAMPENVTVNGSKADFSYTGAELRLNVVLAQADPDKAQEVVITYSENRPTLTDGLVSRFNKLTKATTALKFKQAKVVLPPVIGNTEETSVKLEYFPTEFNALIDSFRTGYDQIPQALKDLGLDEQTRQWYLKSIGLE